MRRVLVFSSILVISLGVGACANSSDASSEVGTSEAAVTADTRHYTCVTKKSPSAFLTPNGLLDRFDMTIERNSTTTWPSRVEITDLGENALPPAVGRSPVGGTRLGSAITGFEELLNHPPRLSDYRIRQPYDSVTLNLDFQMEFYGNGGASLTTHSVGDARPVVREYTCQSQDQKRVAPDGGPGASAIFCSFPAATCADCPIEYTVHRRSDGSTDLQLTDHDFRWRDVKRGTTSRTTEVFAGTWNDGGGKWQLAVTYRSGITYAGTLISPTGAKMDTQCNNGTVSLRVPFTMH